MPRRRARDLSVGAFAALGLLVLAVTIMAVGTESQLFTDKVTYRTLLPNADGLRLGSPVKMAGVQVGSVTGVHLPLDPGTSGIEVVLGVERAYAPRIRQGSEAALRYLQWLSGEKYVEVSPGEPSAPEIPENDMLPVMQEPEFIEQGMNIAENLNDITLSLREILSPLQQGQGLLGEMLQNPEFGKEGLASLRESLENLAVLTQRLRRGEGFAGRLLGDDDFASRVDDLSRAIEDFSAVVASLRKGEGALGDLLVEGGDSDAALADLKEAAASLSRTAKKLESGDGLLGKLLNDTEYSNRLADSLEDAVGNLADITGKINRGEGTLGALVNERVLYDGMEEVVAGVGDSKFARWLLRHYQKKGIEAQEAQEEKPAPGTGEGP